MTPSSSNHGFTTPAGEGKSFEALGNTFTFKALSEQTGGILETIELIFPPGSQLPNHLHRKFDEAIYVLEGELAIRIGDRTDSAQAGSFAFIPRNTIHAIDNKGTSSAKVLLWESPAPAPGLDKMLEELNQLPAGPPDMAKVAAILLRYDIELVDGS